MHDFFDILGVAPDAEAHDIRLACARHAARPRADLLDAEQRRHSPDERQAAADAAIELIDVAIDGPDMTGIISRMQAAFFART